MKVTLSRVGKSRLKTPDLINCRTPERPVKAMNTGHEEISLHSYLEKVANAEASGQSLHAWL